MAARRHAGQSAGMARVRRPLQGHRRPAPAGEVRADRRRRRRGRGDRRRRARARGTPRTSRTIGCASSSPAAIPRSRRTRRWRSRCARCAASRPRRSRRRFFPPRRRSRSASCARRPRSATPASPTRCPAPDELPERLASALRVIYLVFNEGYSASSGQSLTRLDLSAEAIRLGRLLVDLLPEPEAIGLLALMLLQESRRAARASPDGELILLADQDRSLWNRNQIAEGVALVRTRARLAPIRPLLAPGGDRRGSRRGAHRRGHRLGRDRRPLRRAAAPRALARDRAQSRGRGRHARRAGGRPRARRGDPGPRRPRGYHLAHAARADLCRRLGRTAEARAAYERALGARQAGAGAPVPAAPAGRARPA